MRMLLKAVMDTEAANQDAQGVENTTRLVEALKAEAAYFLVEDGQRCCLVVFEMEDPAQIPVICEPLFLGKGEGGPDPLHDPRGFDDRLRAVSKRAGRVRRTERDPWARPALRRVSDPPVARRANRSVPDDMEHGR